MNGKSVIAGLCVICLTYHAIGLTCVPSTPPAGISQSEKPNLACEVKDSGLILPRGVNSNSTNYPFPVSSTLAGDTGVASGATSFVSPSAEIPEDFS